MRRSASSKQSRRRGRLAIAAGVATCVVAVGAASAAVGGWGPFGNNQVGETINGATLLPTNQWISPLGSRILVDGSQTLPNGGGQETNVRLVSSTLSPDGHVVAALSWNDFSGYLTLIDLTKTSDQVVQQVGLYTHVPGLPTSSYDDYDASVAPDGPLYSADGTSLWVPQSTFLLRFAVNPDGTVNPTPTAAIPLCGSALTSDACNPNFGPSSPSGAYLPSGMALSPDGDTLYVALNGANALGVIDTQTNTLEKMIPVGNAPRQVVIDGNTAYVSNEGGRPAKPGEFTNMSDGTPIVSSKVTGGAITGTVSVVNLTTGQETKEIRVGLQPTALYLHEHALFVANSNDDSFSVIDTNTNTVAQTIGTNPVPGADVGSYANAITMVGHDLLVSIGRDNAIADYRYDGLYHPIQFRGLIPTDWYPVQVQQDPQLGGEIVVTNDKGIGARGPNPGSVYGINKGPDTSPGASKVYGGNTYNDTGSVTTFPLPSDWSLRYLTRRVFTNNAWDQIPAVDAGVGDSVPGVIPRHIGGYSPIKHIVVIIKENRTYDQVYGDLGIGNGDPSLAQFGEPITPNQHALALRYGDLDNFYDEGTLSADGHNWIVQAEANDYVEKEFGAFYRSYPSQGGDALAYQRDGFLWDAAMRAGLSVENYGEYVYNPYSLPSSAGDWDQYYAASQTMEAGDPTSTQSWSTLPANVQPGSSWGNTWSDIPSLEHVTDPDFPNFQLSIPDQYRVDTWLPQFKADEDSGNMPNLTFMWLMTDHTTGSGVPDPVAQVADNDLAVGRVVDAISHSKFWKSTAIFVMEDDTQNGVDHVDGHRAPTLVISPYSRPGVDDQYYSQINAVRTIEQILGIQPMNQEDGSAMPMYDAFTDHPSWSAFQPFDAVPNQIPLTLGAPGYPSTLASSANESPAVKLATSPVPAAARPVFEAWVRWINTEARKGVFNGPDKANAELLNHYDWYSAHSWREAYPGEAKIYTPDRVPGHLMPPQLLGDG